MAAKPHLAGASATLAAGCLGLGTLAWLPIDGDPLEPLSALVQGAIPGLLALGLIFGLLTAGFGLRRLGFGMAVGAMLMAGALAFAVRGLNAPPLPAETADLRILFFNVEADNGANGARIIDAALATGADVMVFAEAAAIAPAQDRLGPEFEILSPCVETACGLLVATRIAHRRYWELQLNPAWPARYAVLELDRTTSDGAPVFLSVVHLAKPWLSGLAGTERERLVAQWQWLDGAVVAVGDFNLVPWAREMRGLLQETEFQALRGQPGSWPSTGPIRVPIDHVLVRGGPQVTHIESFGAGLGSNHLGFVVDLMLP